MSLKPIYELETVTNVSDDHTLLVYQDKRLKKINSKELFYSKEDIENNIVKYKNDIITTLANLNVSIPSNVTLYELLDYVSFVDLFEIGVRRLVHDGTDTSTFTGTPSAANNPKFVSMGAPQTSGTLERCYKIGGMLTVIPRNTSPDPEKDLLYASVSKNGALSRNDFYGGEYSSKKWTSGIYPWNRMQKTVDSNGNHFTMIPLYYIKEEYVTDTGIDLSASWPYIPDKYINNLIYKYTFVSKHRLHGYRPAEIFYGYIQHKMTVNPNGRYVYLKDLECYTIPINYSLYDTRYEISSDSTDDGEYVKILSNEHYFSCYEGSRNLDGDDIVSQPGYTPGSLKIDIARQLCTNTDSSYYVSDIRSYTDFIYTLFSIEFATTKFSDVFPNSTVFADPIVCGSLDNIEHRSAINSTTNTIKWNWIENIFGNTYKCIDGIKLKYENNNNLYENSIYVSNNPLVYNSFENYVKLRYILPSEYLLDGVRKSASGYVSQFGYDKIYPWAQLPCKIANQSYAGYSSACNDSTYQATGEQIKSIQLGTYLSLFTGYDNGDKPFGVHFEKMSTI